MGMAELSIISPVLIVVAGGYLSIFPKIAGNNLDKIALCSLVCWTFVLVLVGLNYWGLFSGGAYFRDFTVLPHYICIRVLLESLCTYVYVHMYMYSMYIHGPYMYLVPQTSWRSPCWCIYICTYLHRYLHMYVNHECRPFIYKPTYVLELIIRPPHLIRPLRVCTCILCQGQLEYVHSVHP